MRATPFLLFLAPCVIAANQPAFTYAVPANTTVAAMAVDAAGNTYLPRPTNPSTFPPAPGALQTPVSRGAFAGFPAFPRGACANSWTAVFLDKLCLRRSDT